jgi:hypothetical protein
MPYNRSGVLSSLLNEKSSASLEVWENLQDVTIKLRGRSNYLACDNS